MKHTRGFLLALGVTVFAHVQATDSSDGLPSASRDTLKLTRFAAEDVTDVGVAEVHPIGTEESQVEKELVDSLEKDDQITGEFSLLPCFVQQSLPGQ